MANWEQALQNAPFRFGEIASTQASLQKAALNQSSQGSSIMSALRSSQRSSISSDTKTLQTPEWWG